MERSLSNSLPGVFSGGFYQDEMGQVDCKNCSVGTYVSEERQLVKVQLTVTHVRMVRTIMLNTWVPKCIVCRQIIPNGEKIDVI